MYKKQIDTARYLAKAFSAHLEGKEIPVSEEISLRDIYALAKAHSLAVLALSLFRNRVKSEDSELYSAWVYEESMLLARHLAQKSEFAKITELFTERKVHFLNLKGFLVKEFYPAPELREMTDMDIAIAPECFAAARELLISEGFSPDGADYIHEAFTKQPFLEIELHKIMSDEWGHRSVLDIPSKEGNEYWHRLPEEDFYVYLLQHAKKHIETCGMGIRTVYDFYLILREKGTLPVSDERLREEGLLETFRKYKALIDFWFYGAEPDRETLDFELYTTNGTTYGRKENWYENEKKKNGKRPFVLARLFPSYSKMCKRYPVLRKCAILLPFLYIWRIISSPFNGGLRENIKRINAGKRHKRAVSEYKCERDKLSESQDSDT